MSNTKWTQYDIYIYMCMSYTCIYITYEYIYTMYADI